MEKEKFIWLFGENLGKTANNNSFYLWKQIVEEDDEIEKYFVLKKNKKNFGLYKKLSKRAKKYIVWKDTIRHHILYNKADMLYVTLSYKDVEPTKHFIKRGIKVPVIYLQHGTLAIKKIGYKGNSYNNCMFRFFYYNKQIKDVLKTENDFKDYQLYYAEYHPRYKELLNRYDEFKKHEKTKKSVLWFITWREYFGENKETKQFIENIRKVVNNYKMKEFLEQDEYKLKICLHHFFDKKKIDYITNELKDEDIEIVTPKDIDVMDEIVRNDILITDYSSIAFDFTLLGKPVFLYQPDIKDYSKNRDFYYLKEMEQNSIKTPTKLVEKLKTERDKVNEFFRNKLPENIDYEYIKSGKHIEKIYNEFSNIQKNEITFLGYNFFGTGGTVSATLALAEGLLEKNYLVKLISLKKTAKKGKHPNGLNVTAFYYAKKRTLQYIIKRLLVLNPVHYGYLKYDSNTKYLIPYVGVALKRKLKNIKSRTVVSTRETIHLFLKDAPSKNIENKIYFFHTFYNVLQEQFTGLLDKLKQTKIEKAVFITKAGQEQYKEKAGYDNYNEYEIISNCIESSKMITRDEIKPIKKKNKYHSAYMLRISKDRIKDIDNLINFAKHMKEKNFNMLVIHVYGVGDYSEEFLDRIEKEKLGVYIRYEGLASDIKTELEKYDLVTDFSLNHSFGMTYLEAIFNGKMIFGMKNQGSSEVFKEIPYSYINSYDDLIEKIRNLHNIGIDTLQRNYDIMYSKYSREAIANKFINYISNKGENIDE